MTDLGFTWEHTAPLDPSASPDTISGYECWRRLLALWNDGTYYFRADIERYSNGTFAVHINENGRHLGSQEGFVSVEAAMFFVDSNYTADGPDQPLTWTLKKECTV